MQPEVEVAELEPAFAAQLANRLEGAPRLVRSPPAALVVAESRNRVDDRVEVGRDMEPEHLDVVADVSDDRDVRGRNDVHQAADEPRAANSAGEDCDLHAVTRSSGVSTSCRRPGRSTSTVFSICERKRAALPGP